MLATIWTSFLALLGVASAIACVVAFMHEKGVRPVRGVAEFFKEQSKVGSVVFITMFIVFGIVAGTKRGGGGTGTTGFPPITSTNTTRALDGDDFRRGFVMYRIGTDEGFDFSAPPGATVCADWRSFGAATDWIYAAFTNWSFQLGTNEIDHLRLFTFGKAAPLIRDADGRIATNNWFSPFMASLGVVPEANWDLLAENGRPSQLWHGITLQNSLVVTWQNVLLDRDMDTPLSFQTEVFPDGRFTYRYDLSRLNVETVSNILAGASFGGNEWTTNALPTNVTSMAFHPLSPDDAVNLDRDGDGLSLLDELYAYGSDPDLWDMDGDGVSDGDEVASGADPLVRDQGEGLTGGTASPDFLSECGAAADRLVAWEIVPSAFSFARPEGLTNIVTRTFRVDRASPWQQLYVSSRPNGAAGWESADIAVRYGVDGGPVTNEVPSVSADSWRVPLGTKSVTNLTFAVAATGGAPALSRPLHLLRWSPHVALETDEAGRFLEMPDGKAPVFLSRRREGSGWYVVPFTASSAGVPHVGGVDAEASAELALPPCEGLAVTNVPSRAFLASDPVWAELPPEGTNAAVRVCCWEFAHETPGAIGSGPRASRFDSPYPLSSPALRRAFHRAKGIKADSSSPVTVGILPRHPLVGLYLNGGAAPPLRGSGGSTNDAPGEVDVYPPGTVTPGFDGTADDPDAYTIDADTPDEGPEVSPPEDDEGGCGSPAPGRGDCDCADGGDGTSQCSFRLRVSLGSPTPGESAGFVWAALEEPTAITPAVFNILGTEAVASTTNAMGEFTVVCSAPGGRVVQVTNIEYGVALTVWNASGRLENRWEVTNPWNAMDYVRCRKLTIIGNAVSDETFLLGDAMACDEYGPEGSRVANRLPDEDVIRTDELRGVTTCKWKWRTDPDEPDFVTDIRDATWLADGTCVLSVMSEYVKIGAGSTARRRLSRCWGHDERGPFSEEMDYWCDPESPYRHARLRSVRSDRRPWSFHDYDALGRETARLEQLDGSPFPDGLAEVSHLAELPEGCSATATVTSYEPQAGDSRDRNDAFLPRRRDTWVMRAGKAPVLVGTETWLYTRATGADGLPRRTCVHASGVGDALRGETTVAYPEDYDVPKELRGRTLSSIRFDGVATSCQVERGTWNASAGTFAPNPDGASLRMTTRRTGGGNEQDTYSVEVEDALRRLTVFSATGLTAGDALFASARSAYDDIDRLRSTAYSDGTSETNAYSCCRLLWKRDRQNRTTLRSAQTGTDDLYNATEEIWLTNVTAATSAALPSGTTGVSPVDGFRVTQHFCDALGRETNTVTYAGATPGEAAVPIGEAALLPLQHTGGTQLVASVTTTYPADAWGPYSIRTDERGRKTSTWQSHYDSSVVTEEETQTNGVYLSGCITTTVRNGGVTVSRGWYNPDGSFAWTDETRATDWLPDGRRVVTVSTTASDNRDASCNYVAATNSVTTYDLFGRVSTVAVCGANGSRLVTSNFYDGVSDRILTSTRTAGDIVRTTYYLYNDWGEQVGTVLDGVTNRTGVTYEQFSNEWWKVETTVVIGPSTNSLTITRTQLTGLSDACRRHTVTLAGTCNDVARAPSPLPQGRGGLATSVMGSTTETLVTYDPATGIETETVISTVAPTVVRRYLHGVILSTETTGETTFNVYDAFARVAQTWRAAILAATGTTGVSPVASYTYAPSGDLLATHTYTNGTDAIVETYAYDMLGNRIATTDAHGNTVFRTYDPYGNLVAEWGATYPVLYTYDTQGRRTSLTTFRSAGAVALVATAGDTTTWTYDYATGNCLSKTYADGSIVTYTYTPDNLLLRTTYPSGKWKENVYDAQRRLSGVVYSSHDMDYELQLDTYGNATNVVDAAGNNWRYDYGFNSTLLREEFISTRGTQFIASAMTNTISRFIDQFDRSACFAFAVNEEPKGSIGYAYDEDGELTRITATNSAGRSFSVAYTNVSGYSCGYTITTPNGDTIRRAVDRDEYRRNLVTNCVTYFNSFLVDSNRYVFDALSRPTMRTTGTGVSPVASTFAYNNRSEVISAAIGTNRFTHAYDDIGNHLLFGDNAVTNTFTHNALNQMVGRAAPSVPPTAFAYTPDGGLFSDGTWSYDYDAEDQLVSVTSASLTNGAVRVLNTYDYRHRRTSKTVQRLNSTIPLSPAPPTGTQEWETVETRTFVYDDWNLIHETVYAIEGGVTNIIEVQYFWGLDLSGTLQGAGGVGGLLAVSRNGQLYFPTFDNNGNVTKYIDESGNVVAAYEYDDFGRTISQSGPLADFFRHRFSTKYYDPETRLYFYGYRFYFPDWRIWLNRDPVAEAGGINLYSYCNNCGLVKIDSLGLSGYCHCFVYNVTAMRRKNWEALFEAHYDDVPIKDGDVVQWGIKKRTGYSLWLEHTDFIEQINVTVKPKNLGPKGVTKDPAHCECGSGTPRQLPYRPYVIIDGPFSKRVDGIIQGENVWEIKADISGRWTYDYTASQNVINRPKGTKIRYGIVVTDGLGTTCGTMSFEMAY